MLKSGIHTTEFWLALVVTVCATVLVAIDKIEPSTWQQLVLGVAGLYTGARTVAKVKAGPEANELGEHDAL